jgi:hypothetical protein
MSRRFVALAVVLGAGVVVAVDLAVQASEFAPIAEFRVSRQRAEDCIQVRRENGSTIWDVRSPFGIGRATIERVGPQWPKCVLLRLHLRGLEEFRASSGSITLAGAVSSSQGLQTSLRLLRDKQAEKPLAPGSPFWTEIRVQSKNPKIPLQDGYFEVSLPAAFFEGNPSSIRLQWIDFYRG